MTAARDWLCYQIVVRIVPARFLGHRLVWAMLPFAGRHAYREPPQTIADARREMLG